MPSDKSGNKGSNLFAEEEGKHRTFMPTYGL
jgi:hypothetical protein